MQSDPCSLEYIWVLLKRHTIKLQTHEQGFPMKKNAVQKIPQQADDIPLDFSWSGETWEDTIWAMTTHWNTHWRKGKSNGLGQTRSQNVWWGALGRGGPPKFTAKNTYSAQCDQQPRRSALKDFVSGVRTSVDFHFFTAQPMRDREANLKNRWSVDSAFIFNQLQIKSIPQGGGALL